MERQSGSGMVLRMAEMKIRRDIAIILLLIGFCFPCRCENLLRGKDYPSLEMQRDFYPNACISNERKSLRRSLRSHKYPDEEQAWKLIEMILCESSNKANRSYLDSHISLKLRSEKYKGDGKNKIFALTKAWSANLDTDLGDGKNIEVNLRYFSNEACIRDVGLKYDKNKWMLYRISEECD